MTASPPQANGSTRPRTVQFADWYLTPTPEEQRTPQPEPAPAEMPDLVAAAEAATIRARGEAEAEAIRIAAEAAAKAEIVKAEEEARKLKLTNDRLERKAREEAEASEARVAESRRKREETERLREQAKQQDEEQQKQAAAAAEEIAVADDRWRSYALNFYRVCAIVAMPVQLNAFYDPNAMWLMAAPVMLEGGAWVVQKGAASAVANGRPSWHYRLIAWLLAFIAAGINLWHGLNAFDPATAIGTAFASVAGPGVWDLHEHGRIRKRDGVPTRRQRRAAKKAVDAETKRQVAEEKQRAVDKKAADAADDQARQELRETRQREFEDVWAEAVRIGAALAKEPDDPAVWARAYRNKKGCDPGESIESITGRRAAEKRVEAALTGVPVNTLSKVTSSQRADQMPRTQRGPARKPPKRQSGDTQRYVAAARRQASIAAKTARQKDQ